MEDTAGAVEREIRASARLMTEKIYTVPKYDDVSVAARIMRNHKIHRLVVTHEHRVVGMITTFDLLELVQGHRWVPKNPPSESDRKKRSERL
jgi:CBS domain-containing protein